MNYSIVFVTAPQGPEAKKLARLLLEKKLVACVNILKGVESFYWWQGRVESGAEALMIMKTKRSLVREVIAAVKAVHSYKVCEVIAVPITAGNKSYLAWIDQSCRGGLKK